LNPSEKYEFVNGKDDIPYMKWKINKCLKPPTRSSILFLKKKCARLHGQMRIDDENDEVKRPRKCPVAGRVDQW